ncbi:MAG TPA: hypothetical protein VK775_06810 [Chthoniobacterales bacterium]|jgi:hypothetical protein|nr:hypothetical protein [Chthoniobacterales bacterium]
MRQAFGPSVIAGGRNGLRRLLPLVGGYMALLGQTLQDYITRHSSASSGLHTVLEFVHLKVDGTIEAKVATGRAIPQRQCVLHHNDGNRQNVGRAHRASRTPYRCCTRDDSPKPKNSSRHAAPDRDITPD